jgi:hypothetical protein
MAILTVSGSVKLGSQPLNNVRVAIGERGRITYWEIDLINYRPSGPNPTLDYPTGPGTYTESPPIQNPSSPPTETRVRRNSAYTVRVGQTTTGNSGGFSFQYDTNDVYRGGIGVNDPDYMKHFIASISVTILGSNGQTLATGAEVYSQSDRTYEFNIIL